MLNNFNKQGQKPLDENSFVVKLTRKFERFEFVALAILILTILLFSLKISGLDFFGLAVMSALACFYFFSAFAPGPEIQNPEKVLFLIKLSGIGAAVATIGILFGMLNWPFSARMLIAGGLASVVCLFYSFVIKTDHEGFNTWLQKVRVRLIFLVIICAVYLFTPSEKLLEFGFKRTNLKDTSISVGDTLTNSNQP